MLPGHRALQWPPLVSGTVPDASHGPVSSSSVGPPPLWPVFPASAAARAVSAARSWSLGPLPLARGSLSRGPLVTRAPARRPALAALPQVPLPAALSPILPLYFAQHPARSARLTREGGVPKSQSNWFCLPRPDFCGLTALSLKRRSMAARECTRVPVTSPTQKCDFTYLFRVTSYFPSISFPACSSETSTPFFAYGPYKSRPGGTRGCGLRGREVPPADVASVLAAVRLPSTGAFPGAWLVLCKNSFVG